jgi:hypothetical protein
MVGIMHAIKQCKAYIKGTHTRYSKRTRELKIRVPRTVEEVIVIKKQFRKNGEYQSRLPIS